jgi:hypothetical protein
VGELQRAELAVGLAADDDEGGLEKPTTSYSSRISSVVISSMSDPRLLDPDDRRVVPAEDHGIVFLVASRLGRPRA